MATQFTNIKFKHILFDASNKPVADFHVVIQFYNINLKAWIALTETLVITNNELNYGMEIPSRISTDNQTIRVVREILKSGGIPSFRLVKATEADRKPAVITTQFKAVVNADGTVLIDFEKSWLLEKSKIIDKGDYTLIASLVPLFEINDAIKDVQNQRDILASQQEEANTQIASLNTTISSLSQETQAINSTLSEVRNQFNTQEQLATQLTENVRVLQVQLETEAATKADLQSQIDTQQERLAEYEATAQQDDFSVRNLELEQEVATIRNDNENLFREKEAFLASISTLQNDAKVHLATIESKNADIRTKQVLISTLEERTAKLQRDLKEATDFSVTDHPNKLSASKVYGSIVRDVIKADEELTNSRFKLSNISLNLKTTIEKGPEGTIFGLLDFETAKDINAAAISDISIDITPNATVTQNQGLQMPNILGLTETAVRKILIDYGLRLDAIYHPTEDPNLIEGQSFKQSPSPADAVSEGQEVIVIFAKPIK